VFPSPKPVPITVHLEHNQHGEDSHTKRPEDMVTIQKIPFREVLKDYLSNVFLFGNEDNLINKENPFGKYDPKHSADPSNQELLAGYW